MSRAKIFARVSPDQKTQIVEHLIDDGRFVGMCGDGTNDCGALKAAHVGVSISECEASIVAPFTSKTKSIDCTFELARQGRCALVASFIAFKFMALYAVLELLYVLLLVQFGTDFGDLEYLYIDMVLVLPLATFMTFSGASPKLAPNGPTCNLLGASVLCSIFGQLVIQLTLLGVTYSILIEQSWFVPYNISQGVGNPYSYESSVVWYTIIFMFISLVIALCTGAPHRKPMFTNPYLLVSLLLLLGFNIFVTLWGQNFPWLETQLRLFEVPLKFRALLLVIFVVDLTISVIYERLVVEVFIDFLKSKNFFRKKVKKQSSNLLVN